MSRLTWVVGRGPRFPMHGNSSLCSKVNDSNLDSYVSRCRKNVVTRERNEKSPQALEPITVRQSSSRLVAMMFISCSLRRNHLGSWLPFLFE